MKKKKWLLFKIAYLLVACVLLFSVYASASNQMVSDGPSRAFLLKQSASIVQYRELLELTDEADYGGMYIDENGVLNILVVDSGKVQAAINSAKSAISADSAAALSAKELSAQAASAAKTNTLMEVTSAEAGTAFAKETLQRAEAQQIVIKPAAYSKAYLDSIQEALGEYMEELDIAGIGVDETNNRVDIEMLDTSDEMLDDVEEIIGQSAMAACNFMEVSELPQTTAYSVTNASGVHTPFGGYTLGVGVTVDEKAGWLICGHGTEAGDYFYANGCNNAIGKVTIKHFGENGDFAFIERISSSQYRITNKIVNVSNLSETYYWGISENGPYTFSQGLSYGFPVGTYVEKFGQTTGKTGGFIRQLNYTAHYAETDAKHLIRTTYDSAEGDSGGPITVSIPEGQYRTVIGFTSGIGYMAQYGGYVSFFTDVEDLIEEITPTHNV